MLAHFCRCAIAAFFVLGFTAPATFAASDRGDGVVRVKSAYPFDDTIARLKSDVANKGIKFFVEFDQTKLAGDAGIKLRPSTLLMFGNPPLGTQFMTSNPEAGLDWPVRLLVIQDEKGEVWAVYTDFEWIKHRHQSRAMRQRGRGRGHHLRPG